MQTLFDKIPRFLLQSVFLYHRQRPPLFPPLRTSWKTTAPAFHSRGSEAGAWSSVLRCEGQNAPSDNGRASPCSRGQPEHSQHCASCPVMKSSQRNQITKIKTVLVLGFQISSCKLTRGYIESPSIACCFALKAFSLSLTSDNDSSKPRKWSQWPTLCMPFN